MKCILFIVVILALAVPDKGNSQCLSINLIQNPDLEEYSQCPDWMTEIHQAIYWTQPLPESTSDYFNNCYFDRPDSLWEYTYSQYSAHSYFGNGYGGIVVYRHLSYTIPPANYREYLQGTLSEPLIPGECYHCEFWVKLFNYNFHVPVCAIDAISLLFTDTLPYKTEVVTSNDMVFYLPAQLNNPTGRIISDTVNWTKISGNFVANGGEKYFTAGNFKQEWEINKLYLGSPPNNDSYYFFDNFSLCPCSDTLPPEGPAAIVYIPNVFSPNGDGENELFMIRGERIVSVEQQVFNRWGNTVFESKDLSTGWDGTYKGQDCAAGVYFYRAVVRFEDGREEEKRGSATLVR